MTTYNTYQAAKIANPECDIAEITEKAILEFGEKHVFEALVKSSEWEDGYVFVSNHDESPRIKDGYWKLCNPADYCMTVERFLADGYRLVKGDVVFDFGDVVSVDTAFDAEAYNQTDKKDDRRYILRAAALENIPTETPEEKEVLDSIDSAGEVKWKDKDDLPPVGWRGLTAYTEEGCDDWCDFHDGVVMGVNGDYVWIAHHGKFQRVHHIGSIEFQDAETPQQREDRERACAIYDMCAEADIFNEESNFWAGKFYDLGYKKEKTHGTN